MKYKIRDVGLALELRPRRLMIKEPRHHSAP